MKAVKINCKLFAFEDHTKISLAIHQQLGPTVVNRLSLALYEEAMATLAYSPTDYFAAKSDTAKAHGLLHNPRLFWVRI